MRPAPSHPTDPARPAEQEPLDTRALRERFSAAVSAAIRRRRRERQAPPPTTLFDLDLAPRG